MLLQSLLQNVAYQTASKDLALEVNKVTADSRQAGEGSVFVAVKGTQSDGHSFIDKAIAQGSRIIVLDNKDYVGTAESVVYILTSSSAEALGIMAANFYDNPSHKLTLVGVTGTNGKTTCATLLYRLFSDLGYSCGLLSTVENRIGNEVIPSTHTTPDPVSLNALLNDMVNAGCAYAFMEVSSHAVHQRRIAGLLFVGGIFTNLTHDHLDYHGTFLEYRNAKKRFFDDLPKGSFALTNIDDKNGEVMLQNTTASKHDYALRRPAEFKARVIDNAITGLQLDIDGIEFHSQLVGDFNAYNLMAVYGAAILLKQDKNEVLAALSNLKAAEGRFDYIVRNGVTGIVDYAHTPDALEKVLATIKNLRKGTEKVITVVGCGGDRDKTKRPVMAQIAALLSDTAILTSDNPRTEDPEQILNDMEAGVTPDLARKVLRISDRRQAIKTACRMAQSGDIILLAGKGHEKYQEINKVKHDFDDKAILLDSF